MRMQYEILSEDPDDPKTTASAVDLIKSMAGGAGAHHADALKFGLREGFSLSPQPQRLLQLHSATKKSTKR